MRSEQFPTDTTWRQLSKAADAAQRRVDKARAAAIEHKYQQGIQQALADAERALELAEQAKLDHESAYDELKKRVADGRIKAITLDTSIFDKFRNQFEHGMLDRLSQFKLSDIRFILPDVVAREVWSHVAREAKEAQATLATALKGMGSRWDLTPEVRADLMTRAVNDESAEQMASRRVEAFFVRTGVKLVRSAGRVDVARLVDDYFNAAAPFGESEAKKNEFPDAIALQALEHWAAENGTEVLAVSADGDWANFCDTSTSLVCVSDLATALNYFHQEESVTRARIAGLIARGEVPNFDNRLREALAGAADAIDFLAEGDTSFRYEADISEIHVRHASLVRIDDAGPHLAIIDSDSDMIVVEAIAEVALTVAATFSFSAPDPIDGDDMRVGYCRALKELQREATVLLTFDLPDPAEPQLQHIEVTFDNASSWLDFGTVEPDWRHGDA